MSHIWHTKYAKYDPQFKYMGHFIIYIKLYKTKYNINIFKLINVLTKGPLQLCLRDNYTLN